MTTAIRIAGPNDLKAIQDLNHALFEHDQEWFNDLNVDWPHTDEGKVYFSGLISGKNGVCIVAENGNEIIGYLAAGTVTRHSMYKGTRLELENMFVSEKYRGKGIGTQLVDKLAEYAKEQAVDYLKVVAYAQNKQAISFYEKNGFSEYSTSLLRKVK